MTVATINSAGEGETSDVSTTTTLSGVPDAPSTPTRVGNSTASSITVSWTAPNANGAAISKYGVAYRKQGDTTWSTSSNAVQGTAQQHAVAGLAPNSAYEIRVQALLTQT